MDEICNRKRCKTILICSKDVEKGSFNIKGFETGKYKDTLKKAGYADQVSTISISDGEMNEFKISSEKANT